MMRLLFRLLRLLLTVWGLVTALFLLTRLLPDEQQLLSRFAEAPMTVETPTAEQLQAAQQVARQRLGLAEPLFYFSAACPDTARVLHSRWHWNGPHNQYHHWLRNLLHGNLGRSYRTEEPVTALLTEALHYTLPVSGLSLLLLVGLSVPLGLWLALRPSTHWLLVALLALDTLPLFVVALLLLLLLANPDFLSVFPAYGLHIAEQGETGLPGLLQQPLYLVLPVASLVLTTLTEPTVQLATALRHEASLDYFRTARAKGLPMRQALRHHALRNALLPFLTLVTELAPNLLASSIVVELVFALPGLGRLLAEAAAARDYPVLLGGVLVILLVRPLFLLLADRLYRIMDPRLQLPTA